MSLNNCRFSKKPPIFTLWLNPDNVCSRSLRKANGLLHCCETCSLTWQEKYELSVWQTGWWHCFCQRGRKRQEAEENCKCKASYLYSALTISNSINKDEMDGHVVHKEEKNNSKEISSTNLKHWHQPKDIRVDYIYVAQNTKSALINKVMDIPLP